MNHRKLPCGKYDCIAVGMPGSIADKENQKKYCQNICPEIDCLAEKNQEEDKYEGL